MVVNLEIEEIKRIDAKIEKFILTGMIISTEFLKKSQPIFKENSLLRIPTVKQVAGWCNEFYKKYQQAPGKHIQDIFNRKSKNLKDEDKYLIREFLERLSKKYGKKYKSPKDYNVDYILDVAGKYLKLGEFDNLQNKLSTALEKGNTEKAEKLITDYKPLKFKEVKHDFEEEIKDVENVYLVNKIKHLERLQWIVKGNSKVVLMPETIPKDFELYFRDKNVVVIGDDSNLIDNLSNTASSFKKVDFPLLDCDKNFDKSRMEDEIDSSLCEGMYWYSLCDRVAVSIDIVKTKLNRILPDMALSINDLNMLELPARKPLLYPWIDEGNLILISGNAGVGKSWFSMEICSAIQNGRSAFNGLWNNIESEETEKEVEQEEEKPKYYWIGRKRYQCPRKQKEKKVVVKTLYVDGEMHWNDIIRMGKQLGFNKTGKGILSKTLLDYNDVTPTLNLNEEGVRNLLYDLIIKNGYKFVVLDNLFSLWAGVNLDSAQEWNPTNQWFLKLRAKGVTVCLLHHTNKSGGQMGTASKTFNINTALILKKAKPEKNDAGEEIASFYIEVEKMRAKGKGLGNHTFIVDDGEWPDNQRDNAREDSNKTNLILALLLDKRIEKQKAIAGLLGVKPPYLTEIKNKHIKLFDGKRPSKEGLKFLEEHQGVLDEFYEEQDIKE